MRLGSEAAEGTGGAEPGEKEARGNLPALHNHLKRSSRVGVSLFSQVTRENGLWLHQRMFRLAIRKKILIERVFKCWKRLPWEVAYLEILKGCDTW